MACRRGDLRRCQELISDGVNINGKDRFDYTPLIIVCAEESLMSRRGLTSLGQSMWAL
jgi:hypothetical protein